MINETTWWVPFLTRTLEHEGKEVATAVGLESNDVVGPRATEQLGHVGQVHSH